MILQTDWQTDSIYHCVWSSHAFHFTVNTFKLKTNILILPRAKCVVGFITENTFIFGDIDMNSNVIGRKNQKIKDLCVVPRNLEKSTPF